MQVIERLGKQAHATVPGRELVEAAKRLPRVRFRDHASQNENNVRSESERRKTLDKPAAAVNSPGINRVKPSDHFMQKANAISSMPATPSRAHAIMKDPFVD